jgi:mono/diheme cytochrome c family protein
MNPTARHPVSWLLLTVFCSTHQGRVSGLLRQNPFECGVPVGNQRQQRFAQARIAARQRPGLPGRSGPEPVPGPCGSLVTEKQLEQSTHMKKLLTLTAAAWAVFVITPVGAQDAKALYEKECAKCHGSDGRGQTKFGKKLGCKDYTDPKVQAELKDDQAIKILKEGIQEAGKEKMKGYADKLKDDEIKALIAYMRGFKK